MKKYISPIQAKSRVLAPKKLVLVLMMALLMMMGCAHRAQQVAPVQSDSVVAESQNLPSTATDTVSTTGKSVVEPTVTDDTENVEVDESLDEAFSDEFDDSFEEEQISVADPLEPVNRMFMLFNDKLYYWVLKPVAKVYKAIVPEEIRIATGNALHNIKAPVRIANSLLQGKPTQAGTEFGRFFINSTVGVLGFGDPAAEYPFFEHDREDLGQTLAVWGIKDGVYLVLPFLGPSTLRDTVGTVGDRFLNPLTYGLDETSETIGVKAYEAVNGLSFRLGQYEAVREGSLDPYVFMKNAYLQIRQDKIMK